MMIIIDFQVEDKASRSRFFQEIFLVAKTKFEVILRMLFFKISNADMLFNEKILTWRTYIINEAPSSTKQIQIVDPKEFVIATLDIDSETFVVYVAIWEQKEMPLHSKKQFQVRTLLFNKAFTKIPAEYSDYSNVFSAENAAELPENTGINEHAIELEKGKQQSFSPIYSLGLVELETLKIYIKINLANGFIWPSKSLTKALIFFNRKLNRSLRFYVNYWGFNNITIKNQYPLPLIGKLLNRLGRAKRFTQLDLTNAYYRMKICEDDK